MSSNHLDLRSVWKSLVSWAEPDLRGLCNRRGGNVGGFPVGHVGVHHSCTRWLFVQLLAVEIAVKEIREGFLPSTQHPYQSGNSN